MRSSRRGDARAGSCGVMSRRKGSASDSAKTSLLMPARCGCRVLRVFRCTRRTGQASLCFRLGTSCAQLSIFSVRPERIRYMGCRLEHRRRWRSRDCAPSSFPWRRHAIGRLRAGKSLRDLPSTVGIRTTTDACQMHLLQRPAFAHVSPASPSSMALTQRCEAELPGWPRWPYVRRCLREVSARFRAALLRRADRWGARHAT